MSKKLDVIDVNEGHGSQRNEMSMEEKRRRRQCQRARQLAIKRRRRKRLLGLVASVAAIIGLIIIVKQLNWKTAVDNSEGNQVLDGWVSDEEKDVQTGVWDEDFLYEVKYQDFFEENTPQVLEDEEVYQRLKKLAEEYSELEKIYEKRDEYPVKLLASLCNNPEMYEYVEGYLAYKSGDTSMAGEPELTAEEKEQKYPLFLQWDMRWGYEKYGDFNIALSGCGPTALAMAVVAITGDTTVTPARVAKYSMTNGYYVEGTGTAWKLMTEGCENYGVRAEEIALDEYVMKSQLDEGKVIICSVGPGDFTAVGHFIMIYGYDSKGFKINDPNCIYRSNRQWTYGELRSQIRILWAYEEK